MSQSKLEFEDWKRKIEGEEEARCGEADTKKCG